MEKPDMKHRTIKMLGVSAACAIFVPLAALILIRLPFVDAQSLRFAVAFVVYAIVLAASLLYLRRKTLEWRKLAAAAAVFALTLPYTIPLRFISFFAALSTAAAFLALCKLRENSFVIQWGQHSVSRNLWLFGGISAFYACLFLLSHGFRFAFSPLAALQCLAPAVSEEILFRGVFTVWLFLLFQLDETFTANVWVYLTLTIPFAFLHFPELFLSRDISAIITHCVPIFFHTAIATWLMRKYGLVYAVYAHALCDFLSFTAPSL